MPPAFSLQQEAREGLLHFQLHGAFDVGCAGLLADRLSGLPPSGVILDFSGTSAFRDAAVAIAAEALRHHRVAIQGLGRHPTRVFQAFGIGREAP